MYPIYRDLRERLGAPLWHDTYGVPRYAVFNPSLLGIYNDWTVLFLVQCQSCAMRFPCAAGVSTLKYVISALEKNRDNPDFTISDREDMSKVLERMVGWGDAPWHTSEGVQDSFDGQCAGTTMKTDIVAILEVWHKEDFEWKKVDCPLELANRLCFE